MGVPKWLSEGSATCLVVCLDDDEDEFLSTATKAKATPAASTTAAPSQPKVCAADEACGEPKRCSVFLFFLRQANNSLFGDDEDEDDGLDWLK